MTRFTKKHSPAAWTAPWRNIKAGWLALGLLLALSIGLAACDGGGGTDEQPAAQPTAGNTATTTRAATKEGAASPQGCGAGQAVDGLMARMSLEQKVGQMIQGEIKHVTPDDVRRYGLGSVLNGGGSFPNNDKNSTVADWLALADTYYRASIDTSQGNAGIPIIWGTDAVHGHNNVIGATLFPHNIGLGAANDPNLMERIAAATAQEVKATGIDWNFAPTIAVAKDFRWGRTYESYSSNPRLVASYASPMVRAMQSQGIVATAKHFVGDGGTHRGVDQGDTRLGFPQLLNQHGQGYPKAIDAGVLTVMASFNSWNGDKIHGHRQLLTEILKEQMGFEGFVISDWNGIGQVRGCQDDNCAQAVNAGIDMVMVPEKWRTMHSNTVAQVRSGQIPQTRIDDAVCRILKVKSEAGIMDRGLPSRVAAKYSDRIGHPNHRKVAREAVRKSLVLLKNKGNLLPLNPNRRYLVTGPAANAIGMQSGGWTISWQGNDDKSQGDFHGNGDFPGATSILDGLSAQIRAAGGQVVASDTVPQNASFDAAFVVFGETPYAEGNGDVDDLTWASWPYDRGGLGLMESLKRQNIPVVSVFITGRPRATNAELNASDAFVVAWLPGSEGVGVADVLLTDAKGRRQFNFTGRLPMPWPMRGVNMQDANLPVAQAMFPLGFGLSAGN